MEQGSQSVASSRGADAEEEKETLVYTGWNNFFHERTRIAQRLGSTLDYCSNIGASGHDAVVGMNRDPQPLNVNAAPIKEQCLVNFRVNPVRPRDNWQRSGQIV